MAKKYLLYIHDELFDNEPHKSKLVNNLLERHYHDTVGGKTQEQIVETIKEKQAKAGKTYEFCKHGAAKGFCKHGECNR